MPHPASRIPLALLLSACFLAPGAGVAAAADGAAPRSVAYVPDEVVVRYAADAGKQAQAAVERATGAAGQQAIAPRTRVVPIRDGASVTQTIAELERRDAVLSATPNWKARIASTTFPNDPGRSNTPGGWRNLQWNLLPGFGVDAPAAWENLIRAGRPGGRGVVVAVLDTGVAYRNKGRFRRSPDLSPYRFVAGYDFVDRDRYPLDHNGHGTHVASTIIESAHNGIGVTGIAYGARVMPVRVLDRFGEGASADIAAGIRFAARKGADVMNLSVEFDSSVRIRDIPEIAQALRFARRRGTLVVAASGNSHARRVAFPARAANVVSVGATTEHGCQAEYSNGGSDLDLVAPGGGGDAYLPNEADRCRPLEKPGRGIYQMTFAGSVRRFGVRADTGTSMASPHVAAVAALVIASRVLGRDPSPASVEAHLKATATDLGPLGPDPRYGAGLVNAGAATSPR
jgi:serine protease